MLDGFDIDLAADQTRLTNRCRDALASVSQALERALGSGMGQAGVRDLLAKYPTLDRVFARRATLAAGTEEAFLAHPLGELLSSWPRMGPRTGSRILAEVGGGSRFAHGDKLAS